MRYDFKTLTRSPVCADGGGYPVWERIFCRVGVIVCEVSNNFVETNTNHGFNPDDPISKP